MKPDKDWELQLGFSFTSNILGGTTLYFGQIEDETIVFLLFLQMIVVYPVQMLLARCDNKCTRIFGCLISVSLSCVTVTYTWVNLDEIFDKDGYSKYFEMIFELIQAIPSIIQIGKLCV